MEKKRIIIEYSSLPKDILALMEEKHPDGFEHDVIKFPNAKGELIYAVRVETNSAIYLVKVSKQLKEMLEDYDDEDEDDDEDKDVSSTLAKNIVPKDIIPEDELEEDDEEDNYDSASEDDEDDDED